VSISILQAINEHPLAGAMVLVSLLFIQQIVRAWRGSSDVSRIERENLKFAKQTNETVNTCAARSHSLMELMDRFMEQNDIGHLSDQLTETIQVLEKVAGSQGVSKHELDRVVDLCNSISSDLQRTDSRVVHSQIMSKVEQTKIQVEDVKRLAVHIAEKI